MNRTLWKASVGTRSLVLTWLLVGVLVTPVLSQSDAVLERLVSQAEQKTREGDLDGALRDYSTLVEQFPSSPEAAEALLRLALGYRDLGMTDDSEVAARRLLESFPRHPQAAGGYVVLGEIRLARARRPESLDEAQDTFANAFLLFDRSSYRDLEWRSVGAVRSGEIALLRGEPEEASRLFVEVLDHEPPSTWTDRARLGLSDALLIRGMWREAAEILVREGSEGPESEHSAAMLSRRQALIERLWQRPKTGRNRWSTARGFGGSEQVWKKPVGLAAREDGRVAVTDEGERITVALSPGGETVARWPSGEPAKPTWEDADGVIVANGTGAYREPGRGRLEFLPAPGDKSLMLENVEAVEPAAFGHWFVLTTKPGRVLQYDRKLVYVRKLMDSSTGGEPVDIARDRRGRLYVLDGKSGLVHRFTADGEKEGRLGAGGRRKLIGLDVDAAGNVYLLAKDTRQVEVLDPNGQKFDTLGPMLPGGKELRRPLDLAVDGAGRVYLIESRPAGLIVVE